MFPTRRVIFLSLGIPRFIVAHFKCVLCSRCGFGCGLPTLIFFLVLVESFD